MNLPLAILTIRWLAWDTFRQAWASGIFWLMLCITGVCTVFCLSASVEGGRSLHRPGEMAEFLPAREAKENDPAKFAQSGVEVIHGQLSLAFGALRFPLGRDAEDSVRMLQLLLAGGVADAAGLLLALIWTAGFLPTFLEPGSAAILLSKPVPRWSLLVGKYAGVLAFVGFQVTLFVGGTWAALGIATGVWIPEYLICVPLLLLHFAIMYSVSAFLAVCTRSSVACVFGSILFWLLCWGMNYGRHMTVALPLLDPGMAALPSSFQWLIEVGYWALPKPADLGMLLQGDLQARNHFATVEAFDMVQQMQAFHPELSVLSSLLFAITMLALAARQLVTTDY